MTTYTYTITASFDAEGWNGGWDQWTEWLTDPNHVEEGTQVTTTFAGKEIPTRLATEEESQGYWDACLRAASNQGLDPVIETLTAAGIENELYQSGGFCMIVTVECARPKVEVWITCEGDDVYLVSLNENVLGDDDEPRLWAEVPLSDLVAKVREFKEEGDG